MTSINNLYDKFWDPHWTNPSNTHIRVIKHSSSDVTVMVGRFVKSFSNLIEFEDGSFLTKEAYDKLIEKLPKNQTIKITEDYSDDCAWLLGGRCSYHSFWGRAIIALIQVNNTIKWYWTDGGADGGPLYR